MKHGHRKYDPNTVTSVGVSVDANLFVYMQTYACVCYDHCMTEEKWITFNGTMQIEKIG